MRGKIKNREYARQLKDFSGLRFGKITPTDIDGIIEYKNIAYMIIEVKHFRGKMPYGQQLALERLADDLVKAGKRVLLMEAIHSETGDIDVAKCEVRRYRSSGKWRNPQKKISVIEMIKNFIGTLK